MGSRPSRENRGPWPGPVPYDEGDRHYFFGREEETRDVVDRDLKDNWLLILESASGLGKTSFLRAGLVPELRQARREALEAGSPTSQPAVLLVRDWVGQQDTAEADELLIRVVSGAVQRLVHPGTRPGERPVVDFYADAPAIAATIRQDYGRMAGITSGTDGYAYVRRLADGCGSLILVLDQLEEVLQGQSADGLQQILWRLYDTCPGLRLLLSLRQEFRSSLGVLEAGAGSLARQVRRLGPIPTVKDMIRSSGIEGGVYFDDQSLTTFMQWVDEARRIVPDVRLPNAPSTELLRINTALRELHHYLLEHFPGDEFAITEVVLENFRKDSGETTGPRLVAEALTKFLKKRVFPLPKDQQEESELPRHEETLFRMLAMRRAASRMAGFFSAGGVKTPRYPGELVAEALRKDWDVLGIPSITLRDAVGKWGLVASGLEAARLWKAEDIQDADQPTDPASPVLSAQPRREGWSKVRAARYLVDVSRAALEVLDANNVVRAKAAPDGIVYELVHDGMGPALDTWAEEIREDPLSVVAAITAQRGDSFRWSRLSGVVENVRWLGCWVGSSEGELELDHVAFEGCDLKGTVFFRCHFKSSVFVRCDLEGVLFLGCTFAGTPESPCAFNEVWGSPQFIGGSATHVEFNNSRLFKAIWQPWRRSLEDVSPLVVSSARFNECILNQWTVAAIQITGKMQLVNSWVVLGDLFGLEADAEALRVDGCVFDTNRLGPKVEEAVRDGHNPVGGRQGSYQAEPAVNPWTFTREGTPLGLRPQELAGQN